MIAFILGHQDVRTTNRVCLRFDPTERERTAPPKMAYPAADPLHAFLEAL